MSASVRCSDQHPDEGAQANAGAGGDEVPPPAATIRLRLAVALAMLSQLPLGPVGGGA